MTVEEKAVATQATVATAVAQPAAGEDWKNMSAEQWKARLEHERGAGEKGLLKSLGFEKSDDARAALAKAKDLETAQMSALEKAQAREKELAPKAAQAERYEGAVKRQLEAAEQAIPEAHRGKLKLAPSTDDAVARLDWITAARAEGLFAEPAKDAPRSPANTRAGTGAAPPAGAPAPGKRPADMNDVEYEQFRREWNARLGQTR